MTDSLNEFGLTKLGWRVAKVEQLRIISKTRSHASDRGRHATSLLCSTAKADNNGQKKERYKLLCAVRDTASDSGLSILFAQSMPVSAGLQTYIVPRNLLQNEDLRLLLSRVGDTTTALPDEVCLGHLWYLLGDNCIVVRVKRHGYLVKLMEMEQCGRVQVTFFYERRFESSSCSRRHVDAPHKL